MNAIEWISWLHRQTKNQIEIKAVAEGRADRKVSTRDKDDVQGFLDKHGDRRILINLTTNTGEQPALWKTSPTGDFDGPKPSAIVEHEGGYDAYWIFKTPAVASVAGGDVRMPGTAGCTVIETTDLTYDPGDLGIDIVPSRKMLETFIDAMFANATEGHISLRVFAHEEKPPLKHDVSAPVIDGDLDELKDKAFEVASWAATYREPGVFCPPIASFQKPDIGIVKARNKDLVEGYAVSIECDAYPTKALQTLRGIVGQPTMVVASGGEWANPKTGEIEPKLHIHYRLVDPTRTEDEHKQLRQLRAMLCDHVGADGTNKAIVHPIRWPGSVHRKGKPKLATIVEHNELAEIDLESTIAELDGLGAFKKTSSDRDPMAGFVLHTDDVELVSRCAQLMRNSDLEWDAWNRIVMAFWGATGGSDAGREAARAWSIKSNKHDDEAFDRRWDHYQTSPPESLGIGTLIFEARKVDKNFLRKRETVISRSESKRAAKYEPTDRDNLPEIKMRAGWLDDEINRSEAALSDTGMVYQRNRQLVRVARLSKTSAAEDPIRRLKGAMAIIPCEATWLRAALCRAARYLSWSKTEEDWVQINPPSEISSGLICNVGHWEKLEVLTAISEIPVIDMNGRIVDTPGHDPQSGVYFDPGNIVFPAIKEHPTRDDAVDALKTIEEILVGFPFVDEASKSVALAAILLPFRRAFLRSAPLTAITAPKMGSGKSLIATIIGYITTGREPVLVSQAKDPDEEKKRLLGVLMQGDPVVALDNIERPIDSDSFATILTEPSWTERLLGTNQNVTVPTTVTWLATGNNLSVAGDMSTRTLVSSIDPQVERPEERKFSINLHEYVPANRDKIVAACLTILRAYELARARGESVAGLTTFGRFEGWSSAIREPLIWLGLADPCDSRKHVEQHDPVRETLGRLLVAWHALLGDAPHSVRQAMDALPGEGIDRAGMSDERLQHADELLEIFEDISGGPKLNSKKIGRFILRHENRIEADFKISKHEDSKNGSKWVVGPIKPHPENLGKSASYDSSRGFRGFFQNELSRIDGKQKDIYVPDISLGNSPDLGPGSWKKPPKTQKPPDTPGQAKWKADL